MKDSEKQDAPTVAKKKAAKKKATKKKRVRKKKTRTRKKAGTKERASEKDSTAKSSRPYPNRTLEDALVIPQVIREKNNGHPWATEDVAQASLGIKKSNNRFYYITAASRDYGLTVGTRETEKIELAELGRAIVFAGDEHTVASILTSPRTASDTGEYAELSEMTGLRTFVSELAGHVAVEAARS